MMNSPATPSASHVPLRRGPAKGGAASVLRGSRLALLSLGILAWAGSPSVLAAALTSAGTAQPERVVENFDGDAVVVGESGTVADVGAAAAGSEGDGGRAALGAVGEEREQAYRLGGDAREAALIAAAASFTELANDTSFAVDVRAEAAFRAGELLRARKFPEEAAARFSLALELGGSLPILPGGALTRAAAGAGPGKPSGQGSGSGAAAVDSATSSPASALLAAREFAARGLLELAHLERRGDRLVDALALYEQLSGTYPDQPRQGAHGATWMIKLLVRLERLDEAVVAVSEYADLHSGYPLDLVRNAGVVAKGLLAGNREKDAQSMVTGLESQLAEPLSELSEGDKSQVVAALSELRVTVWGKAP